jgi:hypothetical protein
MAATFHGDEWKWTVWGLCEFLPERRTSSTPFLIFDLIEKKGVTENSTMVTTKPDAQ